MLNEERIILMTQMASYEQSGEGRKNVKIGSYFRSDYVAIQILKSIACSAIAFCIMLGFYLVCHYEELLQNLYEMDLIGFVKDILTYFLAVVGGYGVFTYLVCSWRYASAKKSLKCYYHNLKKLGSLYSETK